MWSGVNVSPIVKRPRDASFSSGDISAFQAFHIGKPPLDILKFLYSSKTLKNRKWFTLNMTPILPTSRFHILFVTSWFFWLPLTMYTCGRGYIFVRRLQLTIHAKTLMVGYICKLHIFASSPKTAIVPQELILNKPLYVQLIFREKKAPNSQSCILR